MKKLSEISDLNCLRIAQIIWSTPELPAEWYVDRTNGITVICGDCTVAINTDLTSRANDFVHAYYCGIKQNLSQIVIMEVFDLLRSLGYQIENQYEKEVGPSLSDSVAYIRNKLTPIANLVAILADYGGGNKEIDGLIQLEITSSLESLKSIENELNIISAPTSFCRANGLDNPLIIKIEKI